MSKRILYVDDNPNNRLFVKRILLAQGYEMLEAGDGESGWLMAVRECPDVIVTDLLMPGADGFELTRQIRATPELSHIPIVTLTAYGSPETEQIAREAGCDEFLHKPTSVQEIQMTIERLTDFDSDRNNE